MYKIDVLDGKKMVKFIAMVQESATLIYDLNTMKGTEDSYRKAEMQTTTVKHVESMSFFLMPLFSYGFGSSSKCSHCKHHDSTFLYCH